MMGTLGEILLPVMDSYAAECFGDESKGRSGHF